MSELIDKNYNALLVIRARNSLFNAGFDGLPRTLPDGTIFATDKALKYCIREYLATFKSSPVFVRRNRYLDRNKEALVYSTLEENFEKKSGKNPKSLKDKEILNTLRDFIDIRLFGVVFSVNSNISLTGPVQISYGINRFSLSEFYSNDILSPYADKKNIQTTIGNETRTDDAYYVYDISINRNNALGDLGTGMTKDDLEILKDALKHSVDLITSTTKFGVETVLLLWFENPENKILNNLNELVDITKEDGVVFINLNNLKNYLSSENINLDLESSVLYKKKVEVRLD